MAISFLCCISEVNIWVKIVKLAFYYWIIITWAIIKTGVADWNKLFLHLITIQLIRTQDCCTSTLLLMLKPSSKAFIKPRCSGK